VELKRPSEEEASDEDSLTDTEGKTDGRNVVRKLSQDNSFIGVVVVALGTSFVSAANSLLTAFGIEPPKVQSKLTSKVKGVGQLPRRTITSKVVRLTDRPAPKLEVPSGTLSYI
jgi:hypothetical protein